MQFKLIVSKFTKNNTIYIFNDGYGILVDPSFNKEGIMQAIGDDRLLAIVITHGHYDHFITADFFANKYDVQIYAHKNEIMHMQNSEFHLGANYGYEDLQCENLVEINDGQILDFGHGIVLEAIRVEGHTSDSLCFYIKERSILITGDTVFKGTIGRVDLYKNDTSLLINNIKSRLFTLPDKTVICPGHGELTSVADEKVRPYYNENIY